MDRHRGGGGKTRNTSGSNLPTPLFRHKGDQESEEAFEKGFSFRAQKKGPPKIRNDRRKDEILKKKGAAADRRAHIDWEENERVCCDHRDLARIMKGARGGKKPMGGR